MYVRTYLNKMKIVRVYDSIIFEIPINFTVASMVNCMISTVTIGISI